jgi:D-beta-D-heptose 7-phosphate kinase/D-beta-D-heptose 1-phosphate adenosyltransferase
MKLTRERAEFLLDRFSESRLVVLGDLILDTYVSGTVDRISPEAPVPVLLAQGTRAVPGGACNVALNIQALGGSSSVCGLTGTDDDGRRLLALLESAGVDVSPVVQLAGFPTVVKTRFVSDRHQMLRVDYEDPQAMSAVDSSPLVQAADEALAGANGVILEDYGKGVLRQDLVDHVLSRCKQTGIPTGYDPKDNHLLKVEGITFATPNRKETFQIAKVSDRTPGQNPLEDPYLLQASNTLVDLWKPRHLLMTLGAQGMLLNHADHENTHLPTHAREVFDVSGAGDTVIATVLLALTAGAEFVEAAELANVAAGLVVAKLGTATTDRDEILQAIGDRA